MTDFNACLIDEATGDARAFRLRHDDIGHWFLRDGYVVDADDARFDARSFMRTRECERLPMTFLYLSRVISARARHSA